VAELEIGPAPRQFVGQTPSFPSQTPVQEQVQRSAQQVDETMRRAAVLLTAIMKQKESLDGDQAQLDFANQIDKLDTELSDIQDIPTRSRLYQEGVHNIVDGLLKQHPGMSPVVQKTIGVQASHYIRQNYLKGIGDLGRQHAADFKAFVNNSVKVAALAKSDAEGNQLKKNVLDAIDRERDAGLIPSNQADLDKTNFLHATQLEKASELLRQATNPKNPSIHAEEALLNMTPEGSGLRPQELQSLTERYLHYQDQMLLKGNQEHEQQLAILRDKLLHKQITPDYAYAHGLSRAEIEANTPDYVPPVQTNETAYNHILAEMHKINNIPDLEFFKSNYIDTARVPNGTKIQLASDFNAYYKQVTANTKRGNNEVIEQFTNTFKEYDPEIHTPYDFPENLSFYNTTLTHLKNALNDRDKLDERIAALGEAVKSVQENFGPGLQKSINRAIKEGRKLSPFQEKFEQTIAPFYKSKWESAGIPTPYVIPKPKETPTPKPTPEATGPTPSSEPAPEPEMTPGAGAEMRPEP